MLWLVFFILGIVGHEFYHVYQLKKLGIKNYWIQWFPIPMVYFYYQKNFYVEVNSWQMEIIPTIITITCWAIAFYIKVTN